MTRPCSIARGNYEPKTIKCQIYDTDQFTMIWRNTDLPFFIQFFWRIFFLLSLSRKWRWVHDKKKDTRSSLLWGESIKSWQCSKNAMGNGKASEQHEMRTTAVAGAGAEGGGGEVKAGVATRWLIPSSISSRSNCWTLLNMTYLWSASCGTKKENCNWEMHSENGRKSAVIILPFSSFSVCLLFSISLFSWDLTARVLCPVQLALTPAPPQLLNGKRIYISYLWSSFDCLRLTWARPTESLGNRNFSLPT